MDAASLPAGPVRSRRRLRRKVAALMLLWLLLGELDDSKSSRRRHSIPYNQDHFDLDLFNDEAFEAKFR
jgi:hypothetical protein